MINRMIDRVMQHLMGRYFHEILCVALSNGTYMKLSENLEVCEEHWEDAASYFDAFAKGPLLHDDDRSAYIEFTSLNHLMQICAEGTEDRNQLIYKRRWDEREYTYCDVVMEVVCQSDEAGDSYVFLMERNLTEEMDAYRKNLSEHEHMKQKDLAKADDRRAILIVEDNNLERDLLADILSEHYKVLKACNGEEGLNLLQEHVNRIACIILDVFMPVMDGYAFMRAVKSDPMLSHVPMIVATGHDSVDEELKCLNLGAVDFVVKPYQPEVILSRIGGIIRLMETSVAISAVEYDELTGLHTRQAFFHYANLYLRRHRDQRFALLISDIDGFKGINEKYGETVGNDVLKLTAGYIKALNDKVVLAGRYGGAQYVCLVECTDYELKEDLLDAIIDKIRSATPIRDLQIKMGVYPDIDHDMPISLLCDRTLLALHSINKQYGKTCAFYDRELQEKQEREQIIEMSMREAYDNEQFLVYYQPKHDAQSGRLVGAEALIRWIHPKLGFLSPGEFIPIFEKNGFITYADFYIWNHTCKNLRKWLDRGIPVVPISVNSSRRDFDYPDYLKMIDQPVNENQLDPNYLHIEVTESLFSDRLEELGHMVQSCRDMGFKIELDDFGTGYSSLNTLGILPLDVMKLDMSFMKQIGNEKKVRVLASCIALAKSLGLHTVAEGVETEEQLNLLRSLGCDRIQGFYYSKPLPEDEFEQYMIEALQEKRD